MMLSSLTWLVTGREGERGVGGESGEGEEKTRTLALVLISLAADMVTLLLECVELFALLGGALVEGGEGAGALGPCACGLQVFVLREARSAARSREGGEEGHTLYTVEDIGGDGRDLEGSA